MIVGITEVKYYQMCILLFYTTVCCCSAVREMATQDKNALNDGDENSNTALHLAAEGGHIQLVKTLIQLGANHEIRYTQTLDLN